MLGLVSFLFSRFLFFLNYNDECERRLERQSEEHNRDFLETDQQDLREIEQLLSSENRPRRMVKKTQKVKV